MILITSSLQILRRSTRAHRPILLGSVLADDDFTFTYSDVDVEVSLTSHVNTKRCVKNNDIVPKGTTLEDANPLA
jgi:hypothetical protein